MLKKILAAAAGAGFLISAAEAEGYRCAGVGPTMPKIKAERFIRADLKNPSAARFSGYRETRIAEIETCRFAVFGWVEATNGYGAVIRQKYGAIVRYDRSAADWFFEGWKVDP